MLTNLIESKTFLLFLFYLKQEDGELTDFISYYHLSSTIMKHPQYKTLNACYMYYHAASRTPLVELVNDCLVQAHKNEFDVFNALDLMDNKEFLEKLKFGVGDGNLQYYIYNWKCPQMEPEKVEFRNLYFWNIHFSFSLDRLVTSIRDYRGTNKNSFSYVIFFYFCFSF
jgi:hypothetical protein